MMVRKINRKSIEGYNVSKEVDKWKETYTTDTKHGINMQSLMNTFYNRGNKYVKEEKA
jgi:hypothetical protein